MGVGKVGGELSCSGKVITPIIIPVNCLLETQNDFNNYIKFKILININVIFKII
jgi:hypothetical protein